MVPVYKFPVKCHGLVSAYLALSACFFDSQRAVPAAGHEVQEVRLSGEQGDEPYVPLLGPAGCRRKLSGLPQDHASFEARTRIYLETL